MNLKPLCAVLLASLCAVRAAPQPASVDSKEITWSFKGLPASLHMKITGQSEPAKATVYLPSGYTLEKKYPLVVFISGSEGGQGRDTVFARSVVGDQDFVCLSVPTYKETVEPLKDDDSNHWTRMSLKNEGRYARKCYRVMLEKLLAEVPNIDLDRTCFGGFSNGANITAALLSSPQSAPEFLKYFHNFVLVEGGDELDPAAPIAGEHFLVLRGSRSGNLLDQPKSKLESAKAKSEEYVMEGAGHEFSATGKERVKQWIQARCAAR